MRIGIVCVSGHNTESRQKTDIWEFDDTKKNYFTYFGWVNKKSNFFSCVRRTKIGNTSGRFIFHFLNRDFSEVSLAMSRLNTAWIYFCIFSLRFPSRFEKQIVEKINKGAFSVEMMSIVDIMKWIFRLRRSLLPDFEFVWRWFVDKYLNI